MEITLVALNIFGPPQLRVFPVRCDDHARPDLMTIVQANNPLTPFDRAANHRLLEPSLNVRRVEQKLG